jgi:phosphoribosylanthranilate isomerase
MSIAALPFHPSGRVRVKICGITRAAEAGWCVSAGADAVGLVFAESPRRLSPDRARRVAAAIPPFLVRVGVFADQEPGFICEMCRLCGLQAVQLHGDEPAARRGEYPPLPVIKALRMSGGGPSRPPRFPADAWLLDSGGPERAGGTGRTFDWKLVRGLRLRAPLILAGGLNPENVAEAVRRVRPFAVDASSGVESAPGRKSREKIMAFVRAAHGAQRGVS